MTRLLPGVWVAVFVKATSLVGCPDMGFHASPQTGGPLSQGKPGLLTTPAGQS